LRAIATCVTRISEIADYRQAPDLAPLARVEGSELHVPQGTVLPRLCLRCGSTTKLRTKARELVWRPVPQGALLVFGWLAVLIACGIVCTAPNSALASVAQVTTKASSRVLTAADLPSQLLALFVSHRHAREPSRTQASLRSCFDADAQLSPIRKNIEFMLGGPL
jgi:hypothetical protein